MSEILYNVYVTSGTIRQDLADQAGVDRAIERFKVANISKVVLEGYRGGIVTDEAQLARLRGVIKEAGFSVAGGLMPVVGRGFGKRNVGVEIRAPFFCYSDAETRQLLEQEIRKLARVFNEVIIDDAFLTACQCAECDARRAGRDWPAFRRDLMADFSQVLVRAAHEENPKARLILKLPQYYDRYHLFGYDPARQGQIFDGIWVGTETRDPNTVDYGHVEPYEAWFHVNWVRACVGDKFEGAWFDALDCDEQLFLEQAITTGLAHPGQITLFCYEGRIFDEEAGMLRRVMGCRNLLDGLSSLSQGPVGISVYRPTHCDGEGDLFLADILGMLGLPLVPVTRLTADLASLLITRHGTGSSEAPAQVLDALRRGRQVILTSHALEQWRDHLDLLKAFGYEPSGVAQVQSKADRLVIQSDEFRLETPINLPCDLHPHDADVLSKALVSSCEGPGLEIPFVTAKRHAEGGRAVVWNLGTFGHQAFPANERLNVPEPSPLLRLPQPAVDFLRNQALEPLGIRLRMPARVGAFLFHKALVLVNYTDRPVAAQWEGLIADSGASFSDRSGNVALPHRAALGPRSFLAMRLRN